MGDSGRAITAAARELLDPLATGIEVSILEALGLRLVSPRQVVQETLYLVGPEDDDGHPTRMAVDLLPLEARGPLGRSERDDVSRREFVRAARCLRKDADAACVGLASAHAPALLTDDGRIRRVAEASFPRVEFVGTLALLRSAATRIPLADDELEKAARILLLRDNPHHRAAGHRCALASQGLPLRTVTPRPSHEARVFSLPRVGGLHYRYEWRDAA